MPPEVVFTVSVQVERDHLVLSFSPQGIPRKLDEKTLRAIGRAFDTFADSRRDGKTYECILYGGLGEDAP